MTFLPSRPKARQPMKFNLSFSLSSTKRVSSTMWPSFRNKNSTTFLRPTWKKNSVITKERQFQEKHQIFFRQNRIKKLNRSPFRDKRQKSGHSNFTRAKHFNSSKNEFWFKTTLPLRIIQTMRTVFQASWLKRKNMKRFWVSWTAVWVKWMRRRTNRHRF